MTFNDVGYEVVRNILSKETCDILAMEFTFIEYIRSQGAPEEFVGGSWNDGQCNSGSFSKYSHIPFEVLSIHLLPKIESVVGKKLAPTYTYARIYKNGTTLEKHVDREPCEYSATITLSKDGTDWPIYMAGSPIELEIGDAAIYKGGEVEHWRNAYQGEQHVQVFLHYVDINGPNSEHIFDKRPYIGYPANNKNDF